MKNIVSALRVLVVLSIACTAFAAGRQEATFVATVEGEIAGGPEARTNVIRSSTDQVVISQPGIALDLSWFHGVTFHEPADGSDCFYLGTYGPETRGGSLVVKQQRDGSATVDYWFYATANDRVTEIHYLLRMTGAFDDASNWPPAAGSVNRVRATSWELQSEGKGANRKISCTGSGAFPSGVIVTVERTE